MTRTDKLRIAALKAEREAEIAAKAYKPVFREWLKTRKPIIDGETFVGMLSRIANPWKLTLLAFERIIDPDLRLPELQVEDYPPHLRAEFSSLIAPRPNQSFIRKIVTKEDLAA